MAGKSESPLDKQNKKILAANLKRLTSSRGKKQIDVSKGTKISLSTLNGYYQGKRLPSPGNVQKIADYFSVNKSDIDPRFKNIGYQPSKDNKINELDSNMTDEDIDKIIDSMRSFEGRDISEAQRAALRASMKGILKGMDN